MVINQQTLLMPPMSDEELPEGLAFAHPEDPPGLQEEAALKEFLREFENNHDPLEILGLFPVDQDK